MTESGRRPLVLLNMSVESLDRALRHWTARERAGSPAAAGNVEELRRHREKKYGSGYMEGEEVPATTRPIDEVLAGAPEVPESPRWDGVVEEPVDPETDESQVFDLFVRETHEHFRAQYLELVGSRPGPTPTPAHYNHLGPLDAILRIVAELKVDWAQELNRVEGNAGTAPYATDPDLEDALTVIDRVRDALAGAIGRADEGLTLTGAAEAVIDELRASDQRHSRSTYGQVAALLREIESRATRHTRATSERDYLIRDLGAIQRASEHAQALLKTPDPDDSDAAADAEGLFTTIKKGFEGGPP